MVPRLSSFQQFFFWRMSESAAILDRLPFVAVSQYFILSFKMACPVAYRHTRKMSGKIHSFSYLISELFRRVRIGLIIFAVKQKERPYPLPPRRKFMATPLGVSSISQSTTGGICMSKYHGLLTWVSDFHAQRFSAHLFEFFKRSA